MKTENESRFLNRVYENAEMGRDGLYFTLRHADCPRLRQTVLTQMGEYQAILDEAEALLAARGEQPRGLSPWLRLTVRLAASRELRRDDSPGALADMLIQGSCIGVNKISRQLTALGGRSPVCAALGEKLKETEENNIHRLKAYL